MKTLLAAAATVALLAGAGAGGASAQMYQPLTPPPPATYSPMQPAWQMRQPTNISGTPSWMQDDGSSSDHPIHNPGDFSADWLNSHYSGGLMSPPGTGFPAQWDDER